MDGGIQFDCEVPEAEETYRFYWSMGWEPGLYKTAEELGKAMEGSWFVCCARENGQLVGMARVVSDGHLNAYLCGLGVAPGCRGRGIGTRLARKALDACRQAGLVPQLMCEPPLVPRYERLGFRVFAQGMKWQGPGPG